MSVTDLTPAALIDLINKGGVIGVLVVDILTLVTALGRRWIVMGWAHTAILALLQADRDKYAALATDATRTASTLAETNKQLAAEVAYLREIVRQQRLQQTSGAGGRPGA